jgi:hypothetical protein
MRKGPSPESLTPPVRSRRAARPAVWLDRA